jgi:hypothetical protein
MEGFSQTVARWAHDKQTGMGGIPTEECREDCRRCQAEHMLSEIRRKLWEVRERIAEPTGETLLALGRVYESIFGVPMADKRKDRRKTGRRRKPPADTPTYTIKAEKSERAERVMLLRHADALEKQYYETNDRTLLPRIKELREQASLKRG